MAELSVDITSFCMDCCCDLWSGSILNKSFRVMLEVEELKDRAIHTNFQALACFFNHSPGTPGMAPPSGLGVIPSVIRSPPSLAR